MNKNTSKEKEKKKKILCRETKYKDVKGEVLMFFLSW